ncbi:AsmA family protein [Xenophilus arseniciresistens]|uniref:AsmA family protein n=1 Tax=Xenophilus arseniciresistens TaxID=1283306 RepID=A0AAE3NAA2_9BURK|nr:AsmA family protein [Xenophilus arseniciresistens]MDA7416622.1 AsmA family protein [Xenophilus arseniciresistens]
MPTFAASPGSSTTWRWLRRALWLLLGLMLALVLLVLFFPWDLLRGPVNRYVSEKTGRAFEITRRLDVKPGWRQATVMLDGLTFANPGWARSPHLVRAERAEIDVRLWPLLTGQVDLPRIALAAPELGLQMEADGRRTWALGKSDSGEGGSGTVPRIGLLQVDRGALDFLAPPYGVDIQAGFDFDSARGAMPLHFEMKGRYQGQPLQAKGRTGHVLQIDAVGAPPFPLEIRARAGATRLNAEGRVGSLSTLDGIEATFDLRGRTLGDLYKLLGVALPETPPYAVQGQLRKNGQRWDAAALKGRLGLSDIAGDLAFEQGGTRPRLSGELQSKLMDMDDLGPLIGLQPSARSARAVKLEDIPPPVTQEQAQRRRTDGKVLPTAPLDFERLRAMDADVRYTAQRIRNVREVPLERGSVHVKLKDAVLSLDPLDLGVAGGSFKGSIRIDGSSRPADIRASLDMRGLQLARLLPALESSGNSVGRLDGRLNIAGRGESVATWLGASSGDVALLMGSGQFGNLLPVFATLVGGDVIKFLARGDRDVQLRCAALAFDIQKGLMNSRTLVLDTSNAIFQAEGSINLASEQLDLVIRPEPKSPSILSVRTPLTVKGTLGDPRPGVEAAPLIARAAAVVAGASINPLLALAATLEPGPGKDADCAALRADANKPASAAARQGAARAKAIR